MLVDIGDGVTDIAVIRSGRLITTVAVRTACSDLHQAVREMIRSRYALAVDRREAERVARNVGARRFSASPLIIRGTDAQTLCERRSEVGTEAVADAIDPIIHVIATMVTSTVRDLPPDVASEVLKTGVWVTGGGSCLPGMLERLAAETALKVHRTFDPLHAVINGARRILHSRMTTGLSMQQSPLWTT